MGENNPRQDGEIANDHSESTTPLQCRTLMTTNQEDVEFELPINETRGVGVGIELGMGQQFK